jgi:hypothetical protein
MPEFVDRSGFDPLAPHRPKPTGQMVGRGTDCGTNTASRFWAPDRGILTGPRMRRATWQPRRVLAMGSGGATALRHYADPVSEVDRRAAAGLPQVTAGSAITSD